MNSASDPDPGIHRGIEAVRQQIGRWVEAYPDLQVEPLEIEINGNRAFVWVRFSGHGAESGVPIDMELAHINTIEGGKLCRIEEYTDRADGLKAAGLSEMGGDAGGGPTASSATRSRTRRSCGRSPRRASVPQRPCDTATSSARPRRRA